MTEGRKVTAVVPHPNGLGPVQFVTVPGRTFRILEVKGDLARCPPDGPFTIKFEPWEI